MFHENKIRCLLAHDHVLLRQGLRRLLEDEPDLEVVGEAGNNDDALRNILDLHPDVVIADPSTLSPDAQRWILQASPQTQVLFLTSDGQKSVPMPVWGIHEAGRAARETSLQELVAMVRTACLHNDGLGCRLAAGDHDSPPPMTRHRTLTVREREVLKLLAEGRTVRSVARVLGLSTKTVDAHKFNLMRKLGVHNKAELVLWAIQQHLVKVPANF